MKKGIVRMSPEFLIGGSEFPEVNDGEELKECRVIVHKYAAFTFEVEEIQ